MCASNRPFLGEMAGQMGVHRGSYVACVRKLSALDRVQR